MCRKKSAFTLSEVLISMTLIGILVVVMLSITQFGNKDEKVLIGKKQRAESLVVTTSKALASGDTTGLALTAITTSNDNLKDAFASKLNTKGTNVAIDDFDGYKLPEGMVTPTDPLPAVELVDGTTLAFQALNSSCAKASEGGAPCGLVYVDVNAKPTAEESPEFTMAVFRDRAVSEYELCPGYDPNTGEKVITLECPSNTPNGSLTRTDVCSFGTIMQGIPTGTCCPSSQTPNGNECVCLTSELIVSGTECICPDHKTLVGSKCVCTDKEGTCPGDLVGKTIEKGICTATGKTYEETDLSGCKCPSDKPIQDGTECLSACTGGKDWNGKECLCPSTLRDEINGICTCANISVACTSPQIGNITYKAICPADGSKKEQSSEIANTCTCPAKEKITLKTNEVYSPVTKTCTTCLDPVMLRTGDGSCECPPDKPFLDDRTKKCVNIPTSCACYKKVTEEGFKGIVQAITSEEDLKKIGRDPNYPLKGACYCQIRDLNFNGGNTMVCTKNDKKQTQVNVPIFPLVSFKANDCTEDTNNQTFESVYDGGKYTINGVNINTNTDHRGLFAKLNNAKILNLNLNSCSVTGRNYVGGLAGYSINSPVENVNLACNVSGASYVGGLIGQNNSGSTVKDSSHTGSVNASSSYAGGLIGQNTGSDLTNISNTGSIIAKVDFAGALVGHNTGSKITTAKSDSCAVTGRNNVGGLAGYNINSPVSGVNLQCDVTGNYKVGGLIGENMSGSPVEKSSHSGTVKAVANDGSGNTYTGGLIGRNSSKLTDISHVGEVTSKANRVGGLVGENNQNSPITNATSTGKITGTGSYCGGIAGYNDSSAISNVNVNASVLCTYDYASAVVGYNKGSALSNIKTDGSSCAVTGRNYVGGLAGYNVNSPVTDAYFQCDVTGNYIVGGLIGENATGSAVNRASSTGGVVALTTGDAYAGGLMGINRSILADVSHVGPVNSKGNRTGGLVGHNASSSPITNATSTGNVMAGSYDGNDKYTGHGHYAGGLVGINYSALENTHAAGNVKGGYYVGGLAGSNEANAPISNSSFSNGSVISEASHDGDSQAGGLVGLNQSPIEYSYADAARVFGPGHRVGGLVGDNRSSLLRVYSTSKIITSGAQRAGGLAGYNTGSVMESYSNAKTVYSGSQYAGGLIGYNGGAVTNSYATSTSVTAQTDRAGGLIGLSSGAAIESCYAISNHVEGRGAGYAGGLIGQFSGSLKNAYAKVPVSGADHVGGLIGNMSGGSIKDTYSIGLVSSSGVNAGGLVGSASTSATWSDSYWNYETSKRLTSKGGLPRSTEEMTSAPNAYTYGSWSKTAWCFNCGAYPTLTGYPTQMPPGAEESLVCKFDVCKLNPADACPNYGDIYLIADGHGYDMTLKSLLGVFTCIPSDKLSSEELGYRGVGKMFVLAEDGTLVQSVQMAYNINTIRTVGSDIDALGNYHYYSEGSVTTSACHAHPSSKEGGSLAIKIPRGDGYQTCVYPVKYLLKRQSPLVLDLKGDGLKFTSADDGVKFDLDANGVAEQTGWTGVQAGFDNAFLCLDKNNNGNIDNGLELFGDQSGEDSGFAELAKYDKPEYGGNNNKVIDPGDEYFDKLLLWVDYDNSGVVDYECLDKYSENEVRQQYWKDMDSYWQAKAKYDDAIAEYNRKYDEALRAYCQSKAEKYCSSHQCGPFRGGPPECKIPRNIPGFDMQKPTEPEIPNDINGWLAHPNNARKNLLDIFWDMIGGHPSFKKYCFTKELKHLKDVKITELNTKFDVVLEDENQNISGDNFTKKDLEKVKKDEYGNTVGLVGSFKMMVEEVVGGVVQLVEKVGLMIDVFFQTIVGAFGQ